MAASTIRKNIWLINLIEQKGSITLADIQKSWKKASHVNPEENPLARRTFDRWRKEIHDDFGIKIVSLSGMVLLRDKHYFIWYF